VVKAGNLQGRKFYKNWTAITRDEWVLTLIREGVRVNLITKAEQDREPKELQWDESSKEQWEWREKAEAWGAIEEVPEDRIGEKGELIHNLVSEIKRGRICSNTRTLNDSVKKLKMKMESIKDIRQRLQKDEYLFGIDMAKYYWSTLIKPSHRKYFRFRMEGKLMQWRALPFGYTNSMQIMEKIMAPIKAKLETMGIRVIIWVDDMILCLGKDLQVARKKAADALELLESLGFIINTEKTARDASKEVIFRGFVWNTEEWTIRAPEEKLLDIRKAAKKLNRSEASPRQLASLSGKVRFIAQAHTHVVAWVVELEIHKNQVVRQHGWDYSTWIPAPVREEITHWMVRTSLMTMPMTIEPNPSLINLGDAGPFGYGFEGSEEVAGLWTAWETKQSTNWRELETWRRQIAHFFKELEGEMSVFGTDSVVAKCYISKIYGKEPVLARMAASTWKFMEIHRIIQIPVLLSQEQISSSDHLSRLSDKTDTAVPQEMFNRWCQQAGVTPTVDVFATRFSSKVARFCTKMRDPWALWTDAFAAPWTGEIVYAFPPPQLIHRTITKAQLEGVTLLLVHPDVKQETWYSRIKSLRSWVTSTPAITMRYQREDMVPSYRWMISLIHGSTHQ
jgi:hypothetical protein